MSNSQLNKLKSGIKNGTQGNLNLSSNMVTNFSHKLLLTNTQVPRIPKAFANGSLANIKFKLSKMMQLGGVICGIPIFFTNIFSNLQPLS